MVKLKQSSHGPEKRCWQDVLVLDTSKKRNQATIRHYYYAWRREQCLPLRCDNPACQFHSRPLEWNGKELPLILDHIEGNRYDNSPGSLRLLCPNCDSQLTTRGGANRGRVADCIPSGYTLRNRDGTSIIARAGVSVGGSSGVGVAVKSE